MNDILIKKFRGFLEAQNKSQFTIIAYSKDILQLAEITSIPLNEITPQQLEDSIAELQNKYGFSPKTLSRKINSLRTFYRFLHENGITQTNRGIDLKHPHFKPQMQRILTPVEYLALREVSRNNSRLHALIELLLQSGLRIGEASRLKVGDVRLSKGKSELFVEKSSNSRERIVPLTLRAANTIEQYLEKANIVDASSPLFSTKDGKHMIIRNIRSSIDRAMHKTGIENASVNDLRNTFIFHQLKHGVPIEYVSQVVGHKNKNTTAKYLLPLNGNYTSNGVSKIVEL